MWFFELLPTTDICHIINMYLWAYLPRYIEQINYEANTMFSL
jgi:hypothetical protein